jgi:hypothetical protein
MSAIGQTGSKSRRERALWELSSQVASQICSKSGLFPELKPHIRLKWALPDFGTVAVASRW